MPSRYTITEPHPTVAQNSYTHSGRGGLGNFFRAPETTSPSGVPTPATLTTVASNTSSVSSRRFYSGRGGAGNAHSTIDRPVMSFDEEFNRAEVREKTARMSHVGRGGAGNIFSSSSSSGSSDAKKSLDGEELGRRDSASTTGSGRSLSGFWGRVRSVGH